MTPNHDDDDGDGDDDGLQLVNPSSHRAQIRLGIYGIYTHFPLIGKWFTNGWMDLRTSSPKPAF